MPRYASEKISYVVRPYLHQIFFRILVGTVAHGSTEAWLRFKGYDMIEEWSKDSMGNEIFRTKDVSMDRNVQYSEHISEGWSRHLDQNGSFKKGQKDIGIKRRRAYLQGLWRASNLDPRDALMVPIDSHMDVQIKSEESQSAVQSQGKGSMSLVLDLANIQRSQTQVGY